MTTPKKFEFHPAAIAEIREATVWGIGNAIRMLQVAFALK